MTSPKRTNEIMEKLRQDWAKRVPEGAVLDEKFMKNMEFLIASCPHDDGCQRVQLMGEEGKEGKIYKVPLEDIILMGLNGKDVEKYPEA
jgi:hypothetical protein